MKLARCPKCRSRLVRICETHVTMSVYMDNGEPRTGEVVSKFGQVKALTERDYPPRKPFYDEEEVLVCESCDYDCDVSDLATLGEK